MADFFISENDASKEEKLLADLFYKILGRALHGKKMPLTQVRKI